MKIFKKIFYSKDEEVSMRMLGTIDKITRLFYIFIFIVLPILFYRNYNIAWILTIISIPFTFCLYSYAIISFEEKISNIQINIGKYIGYKNLKIVQFFFFYLNLSLIYYSIFVLFFKDFM